MVAREGMRVLGAPFGTRDDQRSRYTGDFVRRETTALVRARHLPLSMTLGLDFEIVRLWTVSRAPFRLRIQPLEVTRQSAEEHNTRSEWAILLRTSRP